MAEERFLFPDGLTVHINKIQLNVKLFAVQYDGTIESGLMDFLPPTKDGLQSRTIKPASPGWYMTVFRDKEAEFRLCRL